MKKVIMIILALCLLFSAAALAHSGRTDANGGHNVTADGSYHYHNDGDPTEYPTKELADAALSAASQPAPTPAADSLQPTPTPEVITPVSIITPIVDLASKDAIMAVQEKLNEYGYKCGTPDGVVGRRTRTAINDCQKNNSLEITGTITQELYDLLLPAPAVEAPAESPGAAAPAATPEPTPAPEPAEFVLKPLF